MTRESGANAARINIPSSLHIGGGASTLVGGLAARLGMKRALIVSDPFMISTGLPARMAEYLKAEGIPSSVFGGVQPDPTDRNVLEGLEVLTADRCDGLVAIGGGSSIDAAKAISVLATNKGSLSRFMGYDRIKAAGLPVIAVPTTAGTGSECTKVTVITDTDRDVKMMILDPFLLPTAALVDFELTLSMPQDLTAHVGVDTLTHGIEAYVSAKANPMTDVLALSCIRLVGQHLRNAWADPEDHDARAGMMLAASQGGMAFSNSSVCLVHGMSRPMGAMFHIAHGLSNAMLLPDVTRFSLPGAREKYVVVSEILGFSQPGTSDEAACAELLRGLAELNRDLRVPDLADCGVSEAALEDVIEKMAEDALASGSPQNNPVVPDPQSIVDLYRSAYRGETSAE